MLYASTFDRNIIIHVYRNSTVRVSTAHSMNPDNTFALPYHMCPVDIFALVLDVAVFVFLFWFIKKAIQFKKEAANKANAKAKANALINLV
uniref:DUF3149 domain-containing protein n=1 Tax=Panagrellus redivivus TaxID=6233 RepID=A0A7E4UM06_PANRE